MNFDILTLFPEMFDGYLRSSILGRTIEQGLLRVGLTNIRDFARDKHRTCDDAPFGGGAGMLLKPEPLARAMDAVGGGERRTVYLTPSGRLFDQEYAEDLAATESMILLCGHYEGIDQRIVDRYVSDEISVGNYVLFSGEVGAMVILDAVVRLLAGVIRHESLEEESFAQGLLEYPQYTRPSVFRNAVVPDVLLSGHHERLRSWRIRKSLEKTRRLRPDLLENAVLSEEQREVLREIEQKEKKYGSDKHSGISSDKG